jgi:signal transduction histidine kinase
MSLVRRYGLDALIVFAALEGALEVALRSDPSAPRITVWLAAPAAAAIVLPLLWRRRFSFGAPAAVWLLAAALSFVDGRLVVFSVSTLAAGMAAAFLLGNLRDGRQAGIGVAVLLGGAAIVVYNDPARTAGGAVFVPILAGLVWLAGFALRKRTVSAESAVADERVRIARELHDVVGHAVSVMTIQSSAVRRLLRPEQEREREALLAVERTGREALAEMRRLVGVLRDPDESPELAPQPGLDRVEELLIHARESGLPVELTIEGDPVRLPAGVDLTAYRLVQEGLTNAIRHAGASHAEVHVRYQGDHIEVAVCDDGHGSNGSGRQGHGLVGMRERVSIFAGVFEAGPRAEGGYRLSARLPVNA